jgi:alkylhydroperoxidase/carboxymuconolactone decarboxylase family protein YurZ
MAVVEGPADPFTRILDVLCADRQPAKKEGPLLPEAGGPKDTGVTAKPASPVATPAVDKMKAIGQWNTAWEPLIAIDPGWPDAFMAMPAGIYGSGVLPPKEVELLSIAFDASFTHMYAPGTRRHIQNALKAGASIQEIFEVLKICVAQGVEACNLGVPILEEELASR